MRSRDRPQWISNNTVRIYLCLCCIFKGDFTENLLRFNLVTKLFKYIYGVNIYLRSAPGEERTSQYSYPGARQGTKKPGVRCKPRFMLSGLVVSTAPSSSNKTIECNRRCICCEKNLTVFIHHPTLSFHNLSGRGISRASGNSTTRILACR